MDYSGHKQPQASDSTSLIPIAVYWHDASFSIIDANDFFPLANEQFAIPSSSPLNQDTCFDLNINGDLIREPDETFTVTVTVGNSNDVIIGSNTVTVTIVDDNDGMKNIILLYTQLRVVNMYAYVIIQLLPTVCPF